jgi:hypothetical protein
MTRNIHSRLSLSAWIAASPVLWDDLDLAIAVATDLLDLVEPYTVRSILTDEPRSYHTGPKGRARLFDSIRAGRARRFSLETEPGGAVVAASLSVLDLAVVGGPFSPSVAVGMQPSTGEDLRALAPMLRDFVVRWFGRLNGAAAFVSDRPNDAAGLTSHEQALGQGALLTSRSLTRFVRGVFWGNGLGAELCRRLGGPEQVCREAPVPIALPIGDGAWLQLADAPPAPAPVYQELTGFLTPLLTWSFADTIPSQEEATSFRTRTGSNMPPSNPPGLSPTRRQMGKSKGRMVPVRILADVETQMALNVHLGEDPTEQQRVALDGTVREWYREGFDGAFLSTSGEGGFHFLRGPTTDHGVVRWFVDIGPSDQVSALRALRRRLAAIPGVNVLRLVVGTERA